MARILSALSPPILFFFSAKLYFRPFTEPIRFPPPAFSLIGLASLFCLSFHFFLCFHVCQFPSPIHLGGPHTIYRPVFFLDLLSTPPHSPSPLYPLSLIRITDFAAHSTFLFRLLRPSLTSYLLPSLPFVVVISSAWSLVFPSWYVLPLE